MRFMFLFAIYGAKTYFSKKKTRECHNTNQLREPDIKKEGNKAAVSEELPLGSQ